MPPHLTGLSPRSGIPHFVSGPQPLARRRSVDVYRKKSSGDLDLNCVTAFATVCPWPRWVLTSSFARLPACPPAYPAGLVC